MSGTAQITKAIQMVDASKMRKAQQAAIRDRSLRDPTVTVTENEGSSDLRAGSRLLMVVTQFA